MNKGYIKEIFDSYQGEGKFVGVRQLFIRFAGCSINCKGCDTDYKVTESFLCKDKEYENPILSKKLIEIICNNFDLNYYHSIAITGGEPLNQLSFLTELAELLKNKGKRLFLETSGLFINDLLKVAEIFDILSVDIKIESVFGVKFDKSMFEKLSSYSDKVYYKLVVSNESDINEIEEVLSLLEKVNVHSLYLHFKNNTFDRDLLDKINMLGYDKHIVTFFIPQIHKYIGID